MVPSGIGCFSMLATVVGCTEPALITDHDKATIRIVRLSFDMRSERNLVKHLFAGLVRTINLVECRRNVVFVRIAA